MQLQERGSTAENFEKDWYGYTYKVLCRLQGSRYELQAGYYLIAGLNISQYRGLYLKSCFVIVLSRTASDKPEWRNWASATARP
jgi:hypothetical protein